MARTIPIIRLHRTLIVSIQIELRDDLVIELKDELAKELQRQDVDGLIIEVSGADLIDTYVARSIRDIAQVARLMGVRTVLAGLDPGMASTLVDIGMVMQGVATSLNLEAAVDSFARAREDSQSTFDMDELLDRSEDEPSDPI